MYQLRTPICPRFFTFPQHFLGLDSVQSRTAALRTNLALYMMFSNWFSEKATESGDKKDVVDSLPSNSRPRSTSVSIGPQATVSSDPRKFSSLSLNSPHDAVIGQIEDDLRELQAAATSPGVSDSNTEDTGLLRDPLPAGIRSRELPENVYDPFDGQSIGLMVPGEFEEAEDDLWTHLAQIRNLQSDIARMHAQMERLGENDRVYGVGQAAEDEAINVEDEAKAAEAAEFTKLSERFNGRKNAIEAIMLKLETLSHSINDFHSSRAPLFRSLPSEVVSHHKNNPEQPATSSSLSVDAPSQTMLSNRFLSASQEDVLKNSPESLEQNLVHHSDS